ncbi:MAG: sodium:proton antiporter [Chloroflexota bacterium]|nr:MAG: sodium:proton antiporter [Chloroflexota bacterium]
MSSSHVDFTGHWAGLLSVAVFVVAYVAIMAEEQLHLRKSVPALAAAGVMWLLVGSVLAWEGATAVTVEAARHTILDFAELFLFLLVAITYINTLTERGVFAAVHGRLVESGLSWRGLFWVTGLIAFAISAVAPNLTVALVLGSVVVALGRSNPRFAALACINVVVASNAGGVFSPFGDITTLLVWQSGRIPFEGFLPLFVPSLVNWLVPAIAMSVTIGPGAPPRLRERTEMEDGAIAVIALFLGTIALTVALQNVLHLPPALGMMFGLGLLKLYSYGFNRSGYQVTDLANELDNVFATPAIDERARDRPETVVTEADSGPIAHAIGGTVNLLEPAPGGITQSVARIASTPEPQRGRFSRARRPLETFQLMEKIEWDTLIFFYGVIMAVGALGVLGYLALASTALYVGLGPLTANILVGLASAIIDNVPVMFAVLGMGPTMSTGQWLLLTLTTGVGGSLLSIGSAAGIALMGQARGSYTFVAHLKWTWAIALGYVASIATHLLLNQRLM